MWKMDRYKYLIIKDNEGTTRYSAVFSLFSKSTMNKFPGVTTEEKIKHLSDY